MARAGKYAEYRKTIRLLRGELREARRSNDVAFALLGLQERRLWHGMRFLLELDGAGLWQRLRYLARGKIGKHNSVFNCDCGAEERRRIQDAREWMRSRERAQIGAQGSRVEGSEGGEAQTNREDR